MLVSAAHLLPAGIVTPAVKTFPQAFHDILGCLCPAHSAFLNTSFVLVCHAPSVGFPSGIETTMLAVLM